MANDKHKEVKEKSTDQKASTTSKAKKQTKACAETATKLSPKEKTKAKTTSTKSTESKSTSKNTRQKKSTTSKNVIEKKSNEEGLILEQMSADGKAKLKTESELVSSLDDEPRNDILKVSSFYPESMAQDSEDKSIEEFELIDYQTRQKNVEEVAQVVNEEFTKEDNKDRTVVLNMFEEDDEFSESREVDYSSLRPSSEVTLFKNFHESYSTTRIHEEVAEGIQTWKNSLKVASKDLQRLRDERDQNWQRVNQIEDLAKKLAEEAYSKNAFQYEQSVLETPSVVKVGSPEPLSSISRQDLEHDSNKTLGGVTSRMTLYPWTREALTNVSSEIKKDAWSILSVASVFVMAIVGIHWAFTALTAKPTIGIVDVETVKQAMLVKDLSLKKQGELHLLENKDLVSALETLGSKHNVLVVDQQSVYATPHLKSFDVVDLTRDALEMLGLERVNESSLKNLIKLYQAE